MRVCLIWQGCTMSHGEWRHEPIDAFWVAASEEEAREFFVDKLTEEDLEEFENACKDKDYLDGWYRGTREFCDPSDDDFRFLVTRDMSRVDLGFAVYPYSGMWNGDSPFKKYEAEIVSLSDLLYL